MSSCKDETFLISKETSPIWTSTHFQSPFREKVDKIVRESRLLQLKTEKCNVQRIKRVWESDTVIKLVEEWKNIISSQKDERFSKNVEISNKLRQEGNEFYKKKNFRRAQKGFALSLCFAPPGSKEQVLAYSNRSASFMEMSDKEGCLSDIEKALEIMENSSLGDLQSVKAKLLERKARCDKILNNDDHRGQLNAKQFREFFSLQNPSKIIEAAEQFVEIKDQPGRGRHVIVTQDVNPGTIIILEQPYSKVLVKQLQWEIDFCHFCFKNISNSPSVSCGGCVFAIYCNYNCLLLDSALHNFYECKITPYLHQLQLKRLVHLAFRTLIKIGPKKLYQFWKKSPLNPPHAILGFDSDGKYLSSAYYPINCLIYHDDSLHENELLQYCTDSILLIQLLDDNTDFFNAVSYDDDDDKEEVMNLKHFAASILLLSQMSFPCNAHSISTLQLPNNLDPSADDIVTASTLDFGAGAFALLSMINHSCDPNVVRINLEHGLNAVFTIKELKAGDEVLDNYGVHFALQDHLHRSNHLLNYYHFTCDCLPCKYKWPKMDVLQTLESRFLCQNCSSQFSKLSDIYNKKSFQDCVLDKGKNWCNKCGKTYDINLLKKNLQVKTDQFHDAYDLLLQNKPKECIPPLVECLSYIESHIVPPCVTTNFIQETFKQSLNMLAINYRQ